MTPISAPHNTKSTQSQPQANQQAMAHATNLFLQACRASPDPTYLKRMRTELTKQGIRAAVAEHDTPALFDWLIDVMQYQGISDTAAWTYMEAHGRVRWADLEAAFQRRPSCPKLASFEAFAGCHYRKARRTCGHPRHLKSCPLPRHDLRKGALNQAAYALYLFLRDECEGDLVAWIDGRLAEADAPDAPDRAARLRQALLEPLGAVHGVGPKVLSMALSALLLGTDRKRERWLATGASLIVVDTLVHNWCHRTGILQRLGADHPYGPACYRPDGCAEIIERVAQRIDARRFNPAFPRVFPRYLQIAIWRLCAQNGLGICNGNRIDDRTRCTNEECPLFRRCDRVALRPSGGQSGAA